MYNNFPLNIAVKQDSPKRLSLLSGVPEEYFTKSSEWNKVVAGLEEIQKYQKASEKSSSNILKFQNAAGGVVHGSESPITQNLVIDATEAVEGGMVEIIWQGATNPNITGVSAALIKSIGSVITEEGIYSIYIMFTGGVYKINITPKLEQYVGANGGSTGDITPPDTIGVLTITNEGADVTAPDTIEVLTITDE